jgi:hypothetical protein
MYLTPQHCTSYPEPLLRDFAKTVLGAERCSCKYLQALRVVLGNMSLADRLRVRLGFRVEVDFATPRTMRTLIDQFHSAGLLSDDGWTDSSGYKHTSKVYYGRTDGDEGDQDAYSRLQRGQEAMDFRRHMQELGITDADCPH